MIRDRRFAPMFRKVVLSSCFTLGIVLCFVGSAAYAVQCPLDPPCVVCAEQINCVGGCGSASCASLLDDCCQEFAGFCEDNTWHYDRSCCAGIHLGICKNRVGCINQ